MLRIIQNKSKYTQQALARGWARSLWNVVCYELAKVAVSVCVAKSVFSQPLQQVCLVSKVLINCFGSLGKSRSAQLNCAYLWGLGPPSPLSAISSYNVIYTSRKITQFRYTNHRMAPHAHRQFLQAISHNTCANSLRQKQILWLDAARSL